MRKTKKRNTAVEQAVHKKYVVTLDKYTTSTMCDVLSKKENLQRQGEVKNIMAETTKNSKPDHVRVGSIEVAIWTNNSGKGDYKSVTMQRSYKDKDDKWQKTGSLKVNDIPKAVLALQKAYEKIVMKE